MYISEAIIPLPFRKWFLSVKKFSVGVDYKPSFLWMHFYVSIATDVSCVGRRVIWILVFITSSTLYPARTRESEWLFSSMILMFFAFVSVIDENASQESFEVAASLQFFAYTVDSTCYTRCTKQCWQMREGQYKKWNWR